MPDGPEFLCPRCHVPLKEVRTSGGAIYGCDVCGGRAVTIELLRKRFTPESINAMAACDARRGTRRHACPSCRQPMIGVALADRAEINVDVCQHCHFIWFDAHEVDTLVPPQPESVAGRTSAKSAREARDCRSRAVVQTSRGPGSRQRRTRGIVETDRRVPWNAGRVRCTRRAAKTVDDMAAFRCHQLRQSPCVFKSARGRSTIRIDSSAGDAARWTHVRHIFFPSRRHHSSCWEHVFPAGFWPCRGKFSAATALSGAHCTGSIHRRPGAYRS